MCQHVIGLVIVAIVQDLGQTRLELMVSWLVMLDAGVVIRDCGLQLSYDV